MALSIHGEINAKLLHFIENNKVPNIIFHGSCGSGKKTIVQNFINKIYNSNRDHLNKYVMNVNCAHGKGIKFIRDELKFFAKTHINSNEGSNFKSIILNNADKLTIDAQSALRRCIEIFSHTTRFFIIIEDKYKLLKPILSRFCEIYIPEPFSGMNLYKYNLAETFKFNEYKSTRQDWLKKNLIKIDRSMTLQNLIIFCIKLYDKGYNAMDISLLLESTNYFKNINEERKYEILVCFQKVKKEIRDEKMLMLFILNFIYFDNEFSLENISFL
jgi:hypothetical protein